MKPVVLMCFCLVALLATTAFAAPTSRKGTDSSSESVESNESNSKEKTGEGNTVGVVTEDTNTAQEVTVPDNNEKLEPTKTVDLVELKKTEPVPDSTRSEVKSETTETVVEKVESTNVEGAVDSVKAVAVGEQSVPEDHGKKVLEDSKVEQLDATRTLETVERTQETVQVTDVTQKVNDLPTVEVTVTLAATEAVDTNATVPVTTETDAGVAEV